MTRKDSWTQEEDRYLAKTVLNHIASSLTQLKAFEIVAEQLNRSPQAVGFRWNSTIRKSYEKEIDEAKRTSRQKSTATPQSKTTSVVEQKDSIPLPMLTEEQREVLEPLLLYMINNENQETVEQMKREYETLEERYKNLEQQYKEIQEEHQQFLRLVVKAQERLDQKLA